MPYTNYSTPAASTPSSSTLFGRGAPAIAGGMTGPQMMRRGLRGGMDATPRGMTPGQFSNASPFLPAGWGNPSGPGYASAGDSGSFADQNAMANAGVYRAGTFGAQNAAANGTGAVLQPDGSMLMPPPALMTAGGAPGGAPAGVPSRMSGAPGGGGYADPRSFTGSPNDQLALAMAFMGRGAPAGRGGAGAVPPYMNSGLTPGQFSAASGSDLTQDLDASRVFSRDVAPFMPHPGMSPEAEANAVGYMNKLILRANGMPEAPGRPMSTMDSDGWLRGAGAAKPLSLTMPGVGGEMPPGVVMPTGYDQNMMNVSRLASDARSVAARNTQPGIVDLGKDDYGRPVQGIRQPNGKIERLPEREEKAKPATGVEKVIIGPKTYYFHHESKRYFDEKGEPLRTGGPKTLKDQANDLIAAHGTPGAAAGAPAAGTGTASPATASPTQAASPVTVKTRAERDALAPGTLFVGPDGKTYLKKG